MDAGMETLRLRAFDLYRQIPKDISKSTLQGGITSIAVSVVLVILFLTELGTYLNPPLEVTVVLDQNNEDFMKIEFDISFPHLACRFAEVDVDDVLGTHTRDLHKNIRRVRLDGETGAEIGTIMEKREEGDDLEDLGTEHFVDEGSDPSHQFAPVLLNTTDDFLKVLQEYRLVFVDYYADWCHWCKALEPHWTKAAIQVHTQHPEALMAKVDCESEGGREMCRKKHVQGYPTMLAYRNGNQVAYDTYIKARTVTAIVQFVQDELALAKQVAFQPHLFSNDEHDRKAKYFHKEGCRMWGHLYVRRVPGNFHFTPKSYSHNIAASMIDMSHTVHHLAFTDLKHTPTADELNMLPQEVRDGHETNRLDAQIFNPETSSPSYDPATHTKDRVSYEHFLRVIASTFEFSRRRVVQAFRYTAYSQAVINAVNEDDSYRDAQDHGTAHAFFRYDFSPLGTYSKPEERSFAGFVTQVGFICGGLFSGAGIFLGLGNSAAQAVKRKEALGKM